MVDSDGGVPFSRFFAKVHQRLDLPLNALILTTVLVIIFGCIFLGSSSAFNAIISASVVCLGISYAIPPAIHCLRGRNKLPASRPFKIPAPVGWAVNLVSDMAVVNRLARVEPSAFTDWHCIRNCHNDSLPVPTRAPG